MGRKGWVSVGLVVVLTTVSHAQTNSFNNNPGSFDNNICSAIGQGNTVICNPPYRLGFTEEVGNALIQHMPDTSKKVRLITVGGNSDQKIGNKVQSFLEAHGYKTERTAAGITSPPPDVPFTLQVEGNQYNLLVAPSAH